MRILIIGLGSIGSRHFRIAGELGHEAVAVSRSAQPSKNVYRSIEQAVRDTVFGAAIIASPTAHHSSQILQLRKSGFFGPILVEKPLAKSLEQLASVQSDNVYVAYNLRYRREIEELRRSLGSEEPVSAQFYVGQYLPDWRPGSDYRESYSAKASEGGGVLRDLSHELDLVVHLLGPVSRVTSIVGARSDLDIESEDCAGILLETCEGAIVTLELNYLDRPGRRIVHVNTNKGTHTVDFVASEYRRNSVSVFKDRSADADVSYRSQIADLCGRREMLCTFEEGVASLKLIEAIEQSSRQGKWISI